MINLVWVIYFLLHIYERACTTCIGLCREILTAMQEPSKTRCYCRIFENLVNTSRGQCNH
ncbi:hypothetical protein ABEB36_006049 [Hypothenemus hampei]|uniref:Uncharacterized protein n=1 Tax=Hypothenemus hampei TaxID=57062 RepID=A0ABD1F448_HYPHA